MRGVGLHSAYLFPREELPLVYFRIPDRVVVSGKATVWRKRLGEVHLWNSQEMWAVVLGGCSWCSVSVLGMRLGD